MGDREPEAEESEGPEQRGAGIKDKLIPRTSRRKFLQSTAIGGSAALLSSQSIRAMTEQQISEMKDKITKETYNAEMRDGTELAADVYLPANKDGPFPTVITRTPYDKSGYEETGLFYASEGYATIIQDVRGKFESEGDFYPYRSEGYAEDKDGYDTVEWAAEQPWSNGRVGTFGGSYLGNSQWLMAKNDELPPHLETMVPGFSAASYYGERSYVGGAALLAHNIDYFQALGLEAYKRDNPDLADEYTFMDEAQESVMQLYWDLPVHPYEPLQRAGYEWLSDFHEHETYDDYWEVQDITTEYDKIDIPVLNLGGWYDVYPGPSRNYRGLRQEAATNRAQEGVELVMGPYTHITPGERAQGELGGNAYLFPENSTYELLKLRLEWFNRHLKQKDSSYEEIPPVRLYVPGLDEWIGASDFPPSETQFTKYYLHSDGDANISNTTTTDPGYAGRLSTESPENEPTDNYSYDPSDPVVTVGGNITHWSGGVANRATAYQNRDDILVYETPTLEEDVAIVGPITVTLYASTSAVDTDFVVVLSDVDAPDPEALWVAAGVRRGRIGDVEADPRPQETYSNIELLEPGEVYAWKIAIWPTARVFEQGHRIRIDISSSNFPRFNRNLNTGEGLDGEEMVTADQTVYHDQDHPSHIEMPLVPLDDLENMIIDGPIPNGES